MTNQLKILDNIANTENINEIIFMGLVTLCFIGDVMGEISDHTVVFYWLLMAPIFFLGSIVIEKKQAKKSIHSIENNIRYSLIIWSSAFFSVLIVLFLWHSSTISSATVGLIVHVILGHTLFVSGSILGFRFYLNGLFLLLLAWLTIAMEGTVGMTLFLAIPLMIMGLRYRKKFVLPVSKKH